MYLLGSFPSSYAMRFLLPIQTSMEAPSVKATVLSLQYLTPHTVPCTRERNSLCWEPPWSLLLSFCHPVWSPDILIQLLYLPQSCFTWPSHRISHFWPLPSACGPPLCPETLLSLACLLAILQSQSTPFFPCFFNPGSLFFLCSVLPWIDLVNFITPRPQTPSFD